MPNATAAAPVPKHAMRTSPCRGKLYRSWAGLVRVLQRATKRFRGKKPLGAGATLVAWDIPSILGLASMGEPASMPRACQKRAAHPASLLSPFP